MPAFTWRGILYSWLPAGELADEDGIPRDLSALCVWRDIVPPQQYRPIVLKTTRPTELCRKLLNTLAIRSESGQGLIVVSAKVTPQCLIGDPVSRFAYVTCTDFRAHMSWRAPPLCLSLVVARPCLLFIPGTYFALIIVR